MSNWGAAKQRMMHACLLMMLFLAGDLAHPQPRTAAGRTQYNILFILVDDLGAMDLGYTGSSLYRTPNIDRLASQSVVFTQAYASSPVCSPTRAALMTGKNPARLGITTWIPGGEYQDKPLVEPAIPAQLPLSERTIAEILKERGYRTFLAGKWHLGAEGYSPQDQGFDVNVAGGHMGQPPGGYYAPYRNPRLPDGPAGEYLTDRLTDETIRFLEGAGDEPFFAYLSYYTVHTPVQAAPRGSENLFEEAARNNRSAPGSAERREGAGRTKLKQDNAAYASMVYALDENVGRLLAALERLHLAADTIVVFTSDNGGLSTLDPALSIYEEGTPTSNEPLRAGKGWMYEGGIRVPLLIRRADRERGGYEVTAPVISTDLFYTILEVAGARPPAAPDAVSLVPALNGVPLPAQRPLLWHFPHYHGSGSTPASAVRAGEWKLVKTYETGKLELFNLRRDPGETTDLSAREPARTVELHALMQRMLAAENAELPKVAGQ